MSFWHGLALKNTDMKQTISNEEIRADYERFLRHESMRANITKQELVQILNPVKVCSEKKQEVFRGC